MMVFSESVLTLDNLKQSTLLVGGFTSGGMEALQDLLLESMRQGQRVQVFDGADDWVPETSRIGTHLHVMEKPYRRTPVYPTDQIQVMRFSKAMTESESQELWQVLDPQTDAPNADLYVFSRTTDWLRQHSAHFDIWLYDWTEKARIIVYVDGFRDHFQGLVSAFQELLLFPHDPIPLLADMMNAMWFSTQEWNQLASGQFVRLTDPLNIPTHGMQETMS
jgi:hypothetical protein